MTAKTKITRRILTSLGFQQGAALWLWFINRPGHGSIILDYDCFYGKMQRGEATIADIINAAYSAGRKDGATKKVQEIHDVLKIPSR